MRPVPQLSAVLLSAIAPLVCLASGCGPSASRSHPLPELVQPPYAPGSAGGGAMTQAGAPGVDQPADGGAGGAGGAPASIDPVAAPPPPAATEADAGPTGAAGSVLGAICGAGVECASGFCVDGICCAEACASPCQSCGQVDSPGRCVPVPTGQDPDNDCAFEPAAMCGLDGTCDGQGACRRHVLGTECAPGGCAGASELAARVCDGNGVCQPAQARSCAPAVCRQGSCAARCASGADCQNGFFCDGGMCRLRRPLGQACGASGQCASGACVDGVCCNGACTERCSACNLPGSVGRCAAVPTGQDPAAECAAQDRATCGRDGACNGAGACRLQAAGTECAAATCSGQTATSARQCNGRGQCGAPARTETCGAFACAGATCARACEGAQGCADGFTCNGTVCAEDGLVLYWKLDEAGGATALDASGNGFDGTYLEAPSRPSPSAPVDPALRFANPRSRAFSGAEQQGIVLASMPAPLRPTEELTLSVWYRSTAVDTGGGGELISLGNNTLVRVRTDDIDVSKRVPNGDAPGAYARCFGAAPGHLDGNWHHLAAVIDATTVTVYFDGNQVCQLMNVQPMLYDRGADLSVGRHADGQDDFDFDGNIDEVRIYARALPPTASPSSPAAATSAPQSK